MVVNRTVMTMNIQRQIIEDGAVLIGSTIVEVRKVMN